MAQRLDPEWYCVAGVQHIYVSLRGIQAHPNQPATNEPVPEENACGNVGFNCIVTADGNIRSLVLDDG